MPLPHRVRRLQRQRPRPQRKPGPKPPSKAATAAAAADGRADLVVPECPHRGAELRRVGCGCGERGKTAAVLDCAVQGECVLRSVKAGEMTKKGPREGKPLMVCLACPACPPAA